MHAVLALKGAIFFREAIEHGAEMNFAVCRHRESFLFGVSDL